MEFEKFDPLEVFVTSWNSFHGWVFKKNDSEYSLSDLFTVLDTNKPKVLSSYADYRNYALKYSRYELSDVFVRHWLRSMVELNSLYVAEDAYNQYMKENLVPGVKKPGKVYAAADKEYAKAQTEYLNLFNKL